MTSKKLHIRTYGCQMNVYDSSRMADVLAPLGYETCDAPEDADMIILNTCHIREKAAEKVFSELGRLRHLKDRKAARGERLVLAVGGCVAQAQGDEILARQPAVDMVFGPQTYHQLPDMLQQVLDTSAKQLKPVVTDFDSLAKFDALPEESASQGVTAFLTIQEGCDKFCTFCVVPYTRGAEVSRPVAHILREAEKLATQGSRDITLLGQNVNAYHGAYHGDDDAGSTLGLGQLLRLLADVPGIERLRYTTSHPCDVDDELIAAHALPQIMPFLHLPVQSGSDRILKDMNRKHTAADYLDIVARLRAARPDLALSSDFIVGFPGETDADFDATMALVEQVTFAQAYSFKYSPRPGTPASERADQVPEQVKSRRLAILQDVLAQQQAAFNQACLGRTLPVLFEKPGRHPGQLVGRSPYMQAVSVTTPPHLAPDDLLGCLADVMITGVLPNSLSGQMQTSEAGTGRQAIRQDAETVSIGRHKIV